MNGVTHDLGERQLTLLRGAHGSRLIHVAGDSGALCGAPTTYQLNGPQELQVEEQDLLCWGCSDLIEGVDAFDYPFLGLERQMGEILRRLPYDQYLRSRHWLWLRDVALDYYGHTCALCGSGENVQAHHRTYDRRGRETLADLTILCDACHSRFHGKAA